MTTDPMAAINLRREIVRILGENGIRGSRTPALAQAVIDGLRLSASEIDREHGRGSALRFGETSEEYEERTRLKTVYRVLGRFKI